MRKIFLFIFITTLIITPVLFVYKTQRTEAVGGWYYLIYIKGITNGQPTLEYTSQEECNQKRDDFINSDTFKNGYKTDGTGAYTSYPGECVQKVEQVNNFDVKEDVKFDGVYRLLAPIGNLEFAPENMGEYFNTIFNLAIGLCAVLAVIMIVIGGIQYMGNESIFGKNQAKERITAAILGLLIALGSFALLNTIDPALLGGGGVKVDQVVIQIDPEIHGDLPHQPTSGKYCNGKYSANDPWPDDSSFRQALSAVGINVNKNNCTYVGQSNCTSVAGLNTGPVIALKSKCGSNCSITVTGGTECWLHSNKTTHLPGNSIVDLNFSTSPTLVQYIEKDSTVNKGSMGYPIYKKDGSSFMKETNHYHIVSW